MSKVNILIAGKDILLSSQIRDILKSKGYSVSGVVETGEKALESVSARIPGLVLMDMELTGDLSGIETAGKIVKNYNIPLIFLTGNPTKTLMDKAKKVSPYGYLIKPISEFILIAEVESALHRYSLERRLRKSDKKLDITEEKLLKSEEKFQKLFDNSSEAIIVAQNGRLKFLNRKVLKLIQGYTEYEVANNPFNEFIHPDNREMIFENYMNRIKSETRPLRYSFRIITCDGIIKWLEISAVIIEWEGKPATLNFITDITEKKIAEEALREKEANLDLALQSAHMGTWYLDLMENRYYFDNQVCKHLGIEPESFKGSEEEFFRTVHPVDRKKLRDALTRTIKYDVLYEPEYRVVRPDGSVNYIIARGRLYRDDKRNPARINGVAWDVTASKLAENALKESEEQTRTIFNAIEDAVFIREIDGRFLRVNDSACDHLGYSMEELLRMSPGDISVPKYSNRIPQTTKEILKNGKAFFETEHIRKDGSVFPVEISSRLIQFSGQTAVLSVARNITERKQAEKALIESEEKFRLIAERIDDVFWIADIELNQTIYASPGFEKIWGIPLESAYKNPKTFIDSIYKEDLPGVLKTLQIKKTGRPFSHEYRIVRADGEMRWIWETGFPIENRDGKVTKYVGVSKDITERKCIEDALKTSEERYREVFDNTSDGFFILDIESGNKFKVSELNPSEEKLVGLSNSKASGKFIDELFDKDVVDSLTCKYKECVRKGVPINYEEELDLPSGKHWYHTTLIPVRDDSEKIYRILGISRDITENKHVLEALSESEIKQSTMIANISDVIAILDSNGIIRYKSPNIEKWFGWSPEDLVGLEGWVTVHPDDLERVQKELFTLLQKNNSVKTIEYKYRCKDGNYRMVELTAVNLVNDPVIKGVLINYHDISGRKAVEDALRQNETKLKGIFMTAPVGIGVSVNRVLREANEMLSHITGYSINELEGMYAGKLFPTSEEGETVAAEIRSQVEQKGYGNHEARWITKTGEIIDVVISAVPLDASDYNKGLIFTITDVTERKRTEEKLRFQAEVLNRIGDFVTVTDTEGKIIYANQAESDKFGLPMEEIIGKTLEFYGEDTSRGASQKEIVEKTLSEGKWSGEVMNFEKEGNPCLMFTRTWAMKDKHGETYALCGISTDITERKASEEALRESEERFQQIFDNMADGVVVYKAIDEGSDFIIVDINHTGQILSGVSLPDIVGKRVTEVFPAVKKIGLLDVLKRVWLNGEPAHLPLTLYDDNRIKEWVENYVFRLPSRLVVALYSDTTLQRKAESALHESEEIFRQFMEHSPIYVFFKDNNIRSIRLSRNYEKMLGRPLEELLGKTMDELFPSPLAKSMIADDQRILNKGKLIMVDEELNGRYYTTIKFPIFIEGKPTYLAGYTIDMTARKQAEMAVVESEDRYRRLSEDMPIYVYIFQPDGTLQYVNAPLANMAGLAVEELKGLNIFKLLSPENYETVKERLNSLTPENPIETREQEYIPQDGVKHWQQWTTRAFFDDKGQIIRFQGVGQDITERKLAEQALRENREHLRLITENLPVMIAHVDKNKNFTFVNRNFSEFYNVPVKKIIGSNLRDIIGNKTYNEVLDYIDRVFSGETVEFDMENVETKNVLRTLHLIFVPDYSSEGEVRGSFAMMQDITDKRKAQEERIELERRFLHAQKLESLGVLAGGIAHDFNNLLMAILGNLDLALLEISPVSSARPSIEDAISASKRAADLTQQMLAYSGKGRFIVREIDLTALVNENAHILKAAISKSATLNLRLESELPSIKADVGQIQQVVMNLITNASDAIADNPGIIAITTGIMDCDEKYLSKSRLEEKPRPGKFVYLEVSDTGIGMDESTQQRLFDPFFTTKFTGRGLGMSAVLGILRGHEGAIFVESKPGKGTTVRVLFPAIEKPNQESLDMKESPELQFLKSKPGRSSPLILVIDDEQGVRSFSQKALRLFGYRCLTTSDGIEGIETFRKYAGEIECVLLDLTMPRMDGATAVVELLKMKPGLKVILSSGYNEAEATSRFNDMGLAGFIQKPYDLKKLRDIIIKVLG